MADLSGTDGSDQINGTSKADTIYAGDGDDQIASGAGDDVVYAGDGDDHIAAGAGDDVVDGGDGDDKIDAGGGNDILEGGAGDDFLNGGGGSDTYVFNFTVSPGGTTTITYGLVPLDYDAETPGPFVGPDGLVSEPEFAQFQQDYLAWLEANAPDDYQYDAPQPDPLTSASDPGLVDGTVSTVELTNGQDRYWEQSIEVSAGTPEITASDGNDTIAQFQDAGPNVDTIVLNGLAGLSAETLDALFDLEVADKDGDGVNDTVLAWDGGSITILGTSEWGTDVNAFFSDDRVQLA